MQSASYQKPEQWRWTMQYRIEARMPFKMSLEILFLFSSYFKDTFRKWTVNFWKRLRKAILLHAQEVSSVTIFFPKRPALK